MAVQTQGVVMEAGRPSQAGRAGVNRVAPGFGYLREPPRAGIGIRF